VLGFVSFISEEVIGFVAHAEKTDLANAFADGAFPFGELCALVIIE
jgi:hypothetical protein